MTGPSTYSQWYNGSGKGTTAYGANSVYYVDYKNHNFYFNVSPFYVAATSGNTWQQVVAASLAQNVVATLPDPGQGTANYNISPNALVNGNLISASGTAGLTQDSGVSASSVSNLITQVGNVTTVSVTLNTAAMQAAYATPQQLIAAPGAGKTIIIQEASVYTASTGNTAYATGTAPIIQYGNTVHGGGTSATGSGLVAGDITAASSQIRTVTSPTGALTGVTNAGIFFSNATGAYTNGTGTNVVFTLTYVTLTATV